MKACLYEIENGDIFCDVRGENSGRKLAHTAVVRKLDSLGDMDSVNRNFTATHNAVIEKG